MYVMYMVSGSLASLGFRVYSKVSGLGVAWWWVSGIGFWVPGLLGARFRAHMFRTG